MCVCVFQLFCFCVFAMFVEVMLRGWFCSGFRLIDVDCLAVLICLMVSFIEFVFFFIFFTRGRCGEHAFVEAISAILAGV